MGRPANLNVQQHFRKFQNHPDYKLGAVSCRYCEKTLAIGTTRQQEHLKQCTSYQRTVPTAKKRKLDDAGSHRNAFDHIHPSEHSELDTLAATMIYDAGLSLSHFEHPAVQAFLYRLRPAYSLPSRFRLSNSLLDDSYQTVKKEVDQYLDQQDNLCLSFDESNDACHNRIMNIAVTTDRGAFHLLNVDIGSAKATAEFCAKTIEDQALVITKGSTQRINSISTDTCDTMLKTGRLLQALPSLQHAFMIPCDPHGLQLLVQDLCGYSAFSGVPLPYSHLSINRLCYIHLLYPV